MKRKCCRAVYQAPLQYVKSCDHSKRGLVTSKACQAASHEFGIGRTCQQCFKRGLKHSPTRGVFEEEIYKRHYLFIICIQSRESMSLLEFIRFDYILFRHIYIQVQLALSDTQSRIYKHICNYNTNIHTNTKKYIQVGRVGDILCVRRVFV